MSFFAGLDPYMFALLAGVVGLWFTMRFLAKPNLSFKPSSCKSGSSRLGGSSLGALAAMFTREAPILIPGLGQKAITTLLESVQNFVAQTRDREALILVGAFASRKAEPYSTVELIILCETTSKYADKTALDTWSYPQNGHDIRKHEVEQAENVVRHVFELRGAPPVRLHFVAAANDAEGLGEKTISTLIKQGVVVVYDPMGVARTWLKQGQKNEED